MFIKYIFAVFILCTPFCGCDRELVMIPNSDNCVILGAKCLEFVSTAKNWFLAHAHCRRNLGFLANFADEKEFQVMANYLKSHDVGATRFWIDGNDNGDQGQFVSFKTGRNVTYYKWTQGEPNNFHNAEHCIELRKGDEINMNDEYCNDPLYFICEFDAEI